MSILYLQSTFRELDDDLLQSMLDFQEEIHQSSPRDDVLRSRQYRYRNLLKPDRQNEIYQRYFAIVDRKVVANAYIGFNKVEQDTNPNHIWFHMQVLPEYRRQGIGTVLFEKCQKFANQVERLHLRTGFYPVDTPDTKKFLERRNFAKVFDERISRLYRDKINWEYIKKVEEKYHENVKDYTFLKLTRLEWAEKILDDEAFRTEMADFFTEAEALMPMEDAEQNDQIISADDLVKSANHILETRNLSESINFYALDDQKIIGMSGTYYPNDPPVRDVGTGLTAVRAAYQRQGLATLLKSKIIREYINQMPKFEYISTENANSNDGMLGINYKLGFETVEKWEMWERPIV